MNGKKAKVLRRMARQHVEAGTPYEKYGRNKLTGMVVLMRGCEKWAYRQLKRWYKPGIV